MLVPHLLVIPLTELRMSTEYVIQPGAVTSSSVLWLLKQIT